MGDLEMAEYWTFERFLEFADAYGYKLMGFWNPYRVFVNPDEPDALPWLVPVHEGIVDIEYVKKFKRWLKRKGILRDEDEDKNQINGPEEGI
jgi:hypothetical protein